MIMLSVIIPEGRKAKFTELICKKALGELEYEIIHARTWREGLRVANGEFVCFLDPDCDFSEDYFKTNMELFTSQPTFRKLAMIASAVDIGDKHKLYGYMLGLDGTLPAVFPSRIKSSHEPYGIQIGYIPGAIIRHSVLNEASLRHDDPVAASIKLSLDLWQAGSRCYINPQTVYYPLGESKRRIDLPLEVKNLPSYTYELHQMFKRELIG